MSEVAHGDERDTGTSDTAEVARLVIAWLWVGIPAVWGIYHVVVDATKLFRP